MIFATTQTTPQLDPISSFFAQYGLLLILLVLIVFMFWSSRRRAARMKVEQENKQRAMVPGVKVLLQGGLYGTLVEFDGVDLSKPALVELAPGMQVEVHSQAILRVVDPEDEVVPEAIEPTVDEVAFSDDVTPSTADDVAPDADDKPKA
jgi:preprotein translocase subunit YajC